MIQQFRIFLALIIFFSFSFKTLATPAITPSCPAGQTQELGLNLSTYDTTGYNTYPNNHAQYDTLKANYAIPAKIFGSGRVANINGSGNPYGSDSNYLSIFTGYIEAPTTGVYGIGIDGASGFMTIQSPNLYGGSTTTLTDNADGDEGLFIDTAGNRELVVDCGTLSTGQSCIVTYRVVVN